MNALSASRLPATTGATVSLAGIAFVGAGLWARREVHAGLARERIVGTSDSSPANAPIKNGSAARSLAEAIRRSTVAAADGRTYAETDMFVGVDGSPTSDEARAIVDERTGKPVQHPDQTLWLQSTTLQTALMQAYMGERLADLTVGLGAAFFAAGLGLAAVARAS